MKKENLIRRFFTDASWQMISQIYSMLLSLVVGAISARYLGPSNYGLIGYGHSFVAIFTSLSTLGMGVVVIKDLVNKPDERGEIIGTSLVMRIISSTLCVGIIDIVVCVVQPDDNLFRLVTFLQSIALIFQGFDTLGYWFQSRLQYKYISIASMIAYTAVGVWRIVMLVNKTTVEWFAFSSCLQHIVVAIILIATFSSKHVAKLSFSLSRAKSIFSRSYHFILSGLAIALYTQVDKVMLGSLMDDATVGYYTAASTIAVMWEFVPNALINSSKAVVFENKAKNEKKYIDWLSYLLCGITVMGILVGICFMLFGKLAIFILYGEEYMSAVAPLNILIWSTSFAMIGTARGSTWLIAENLNKYAKYYVFISSIVNIVLNALLIPIWGMIGAAIATLISQIVTAFIAPICFKKTRSFILLYIRSWKISFIALKDYLKARRGVNG